MYSQTFIQTRRTLAAATFLAAMATVSGAQEVASRSQGWTLRIPSGALVTTGAQRSQVGNGQLSALQLSRQVLPWATVTGTFTWARSADIANAARPKLDVFQSDIGLETCNHEWFSTAPADFGTFAGFGGGMRSYNYRSLDVDATNNLAGYVSAGGELGIRRIAVRVEARDYLTSFKPLAGAGKAERRNDVMLMVAFRFNRHATEAR